VRVRDTRVWIDRDVPPQAEPVADPTSAHLGHLEHAWNVATRVLNGIQDMRFAPSSIRLNTT
jgi:hypothetical protein